MHVVCLIPDSPHISMFVMAFIRANHGGVSGKSDHTMRLSDLSPSGQKFATSDDTQPPAVRQQHPVMSDTQQPPAVRQQTPQQQIITSAADPSPQSSGGRNAFDDSQVHALVGSVEKGCSCCFHVEM